jgi:ABC-type antimicrobial peptide transport system permease subunit
VLLKQYARPFGFGLLAGMALAVGGERWLIEIRLGLGVTAFDLAGYLLGLVAFALTALVAILVPLRRALHIDPATVLRSE